MEYLQLIMWLKGENYGNLLEVVWYMNLDHSYIWNLHTVYISIKFCHLLYILAKSQMKLVI